MVVLGRDDVRGPAGKKSPGRNNVAWPDQTPFDERRLDPLADRVLEFGLDDEQRAKPKLIARPFCARVMRRQRARRLVFPVATKRNGDRRAGSAVIAVGRGYHRGLMREGLPHPRILPRPAGCSPETH